MKTLLQLLADNPRGWGNAPGPAPEVAFVDELGNGFGFNGQMVAPSNTGYDEQRSIADTAKGIATAPARIATGLLSSLMPYGEEGWQVPGLAQEAMSAISAPGRAYYEGMSPEEAQRTAASAAGFAMGGGGLAAGRGPMVAANASKEGALPALANALDMSPEARLARAKDLGFDTDTTWYHGTNKDFEAFKDPRRGNGIYMTTDPELASQYAKNRSEYEGAPAVYPLRVRSDRLASKKDVVAAEDAVRSLGGSYSDAIVDQELASRGFDGYRDEHISFLFDPKNIRSVNAAFDPAMADSANLLAANASKGAGAASVASEPNNQTDILGLLSSLFARGRK